MADLQILDSSSHSLTFQATVNITNPTEYTAHIPFVSINILSNDSVLAQAIAKDLVIVPGLNERVRVETVWDPLRLGGGRAKDVGRELLSQYISGWSPLCSNSPFIDRQTFALFLLPPS